MTSTTFAATTANDMTAKTSRVDARRSDACSVDGRDCSDVSCRASGCQMAFLEERNERLEVALNQIAQLIDAFPLDGALSAGNMRLVQGAGAIARRALMIDFREMQTCVT